MIKNINITIDGKKIVAKQGQTILDVAEENEIFIPRLCFLKGIHEEGDCRLCSVKINDQSNLKSACRTIIEEDMNILTDDLDVYDRVTMNLEFLTHKHTFNCFSCSREGACEFLDLVKRYSIDDEITKKYGTNDSPLYFSDSSGVMVIDSAKCVLCGRCVSACESFTGLSVLGYNERGANTYIGPALFHNLEDAGCIYCGKCMQACPTGALREKDDIKRFEQAIRDRTKKVIVQVAPSVRAALGEEFGYPIGTNVEGKVFAALKALGVDQIIDTNFTADLTIMEEGSEFIDRLNNNGPFPMLTSCSPGWVNYLEIYNPELIPNLSSCKSPQQMAGAVVKTYYSKQLDLKPEEIVSVAIMPCIAKKEEARRSDMGRDGYQDVDIVLTTREFARLIKHRGIDFRALKPRKAFGELAVYTGAGNIFGATGGVMEAALRTVTELLEEKPTAINFEEVRGLKDIKEATYVVKGMNINIAVVHGGAAIKEFMEILKKSNKTYHFVELMGCTGGCINGGGQPYLNSRQFESIDIRGLRAKVLYDIDENSQIRKSHKNPSIEKIYKDFLGKPNSKIAHELLHTKYKKRPNYNNI